MKEFKYVITDKGGIHARPAGALVKEAAAFPLQKMEKQQMQNVFLELWDLV